MRVNLIKFLFHVDFFIEIAIHLPPSLSILMLPLTVLIPKANVSERKQFFLLFFFFFVFDNLFFHSLISSEVFFFIIIFEFFQKSIFLSVSYKLTDDPVTVFLITLSYMYKQDAESINAVLSRDFDPMDRCHLQKELTISGFLLSSDTCQGHALNVRLLLSLKHDKLWKVLLETIVSILMIIIHVKILNKHLNDGKSLLLNWPFRSFEKKIIQFSNSIFVYIFLFV